nr:immunoglobulin light chain junction region [Macaca mulatta]MPO03026.1 immunoglobulin light chain junction region [Macaca mulatta]MPO03112.1 immunoglobulin light chain junction region [Macaca mulatta]MPO03482.1 immunoglobulin light chain junction region [Macaca mulatta]MPO03642.1 immunoglobulin light chain junction region [Macaca mulatta]
CAAWDDSLRGYIF